MNRMSQLGYRVLHICQNPFTCFGLKDFEDKINKKGLMSMLYFHFSGFKNSQTCLILIHLSLKHCHHLIKS